MIFTTARQLAISFVSESLLADVAEGDELAISILNSDIGVFTRLWALTDEQLVVELAQIRESQRYAADHRDWDEYEGWEVARYEVYAVQTNREAIADAAEQARFIEVVEGPQGPLTYRPFAALAGVV